MDVDVALSGAGALFLVTDLLENRAGRVGQGDAKRKAHSRGLSSF